MEWIKSSHSADQGECVEVARLPDGGRAVRDSKDPHGPVLTFTTEQFSAFLADVKCQTHASE